MPGAAGGAQGAAGALTEDTARYWYILITTYGLCVQKTNVFSTHYIMRTHQLSTFSLSILAAREQHRLEIENFEHLMRANQQVLREQAARYSEQVSRLARSDAAVRRLAAENETLLVAIQTLEDSIRGTRDDTSTKSDGSSSDGSSSSASSGDVSSSPQMECLEFIHEALCASLTDEVAMLGVGGASDESSPLAKCRDESPSSSYHPFAIEMSREEED